MTHEEMERKKRAILQSLAEGARAESAAPDEDDEEDGDIFVSTVTEAIALLLMHKEPGGARYRRRLIRFITDPKHQVYDSPNIYHNFVMHLFKLRDYIAALEVCDFVLRFAIFSATRSAPAARAASLKGVSGISRGPWRFRRSSGAGVCSATVWIFSRRR